MGPIFYFLLAIFLLVFTYVVFRLIVGRDYTARIRLGAFSSNMKQIVFIGFFSFPYQFNQLLLWFIPVLIISTLASIFPAIRVTWVGMHETLSYE